MTVTLMAEREQDDPSCPTQGCRTTFRQVFELILFSHEAYYANPLRSTLAVLRWENGNDFLIDELGCSAL